jgi:hypothetical protein
MLIAVGFDGVIVPDIFLPDKDITEEMPGAIRTLNDLADLGHTIVLWTSRDSQRILPSRSFNIMLEFLKKSGFTRFHTGCSYRVINKIPADLFIDDKVIGGFPGWDQVRCALKLPRI